MREFLTKSKVHEVRIMEDEDKIKFKGIPIGTIFKIRNLADGNKAIAKLLAYVFSDKSKDSKIETVDTLADAESGQRNTCTTIHAAENSTISMRTGELEKGIGGLQAVITSAEAEDLVCEIIFHSAFEEFKGMKKDKAYPIIMDWDTEIFIGMLLGSIKASSGVLNVLGKLFPQMPSNAAKLVDEALAEL